MLKSSRFFITIVLKFEPDEIWTGREVVWKKKSVLQAFVASEGCAQDIDANDCVLHCHRPISLKRIRCRQIIFHMLTDDQTNWRSAQ